MNKRKLLQTLGVLYLLHLGLGITYLKAQNINPKESINEITIYAIPTWYPMMWDNPAKLYKSVNKCLLKTALKPDTYLLGHIAVSLRSNLLPATILTGMKSSDAKEKIDYVLKQKIGFAILGATLAGQLETADELKQKLEAYSKRGKLAFITYRINDQAAGRMIEFINKFKDTTNQQVAACNYYGGAFWPRYHNEGAGCSTFAMALLDVANLLTPETKSWLIDVKVPMTLIGGEFNANKKIKKTTIHKTTNWYEGKGTENIDYVRYRVHDPSVLFHWIMNQRKTKSSAFTPKNENNVPGLYIDCRNIDTQMNTPIFMSRPDSNIFIDKYWDKRISNLKKKK